MSKHLPGLHVMSGGLGVSGGLEVSGCLEVSMGLEELGQSCCEWDLEGWPLQGEK